MLIRLKSCLGLFDSCGFLVQGDSGGGLTRSVLKLLDSLETDDPMAPHAQQNAKRRSVPSKTGFLSWVANSAISALSTAAFGHNGMDTTVGPAGPYASSSPVSLREKLSTLKPSELQAWSVAEGVAEADIVEAVDSDDPKSALIEAIIATTTGGEARTAEAVRPPKGQGDIESPSARPPVRQPRSTFYGATTDATAADATRTDEPAYPSREQGDIEKQRLLQSGRAQTRVRTPPSARIRNRGKPVPTRVRGESHVRTRGEPPLQTRVPGASPVRICTPVRARPEEADAAAPMQSQVAPATPTQQQRTEDAGASPAMKTVRAAIKAATEAGQYEKLELLVAEMRTTEVAEAAAAVQAAAVAEAVAEAMVAAEAMAAAERAAAAEAMVAAEALAAEAVAEKLAAEDVVAQVKAASAAAKVLAQQKAMATFRQVQVAALQAKIKTATEAGEYDQLPSLVAEIKALQVTTPSARRPKSPPRENPRLSKVPPALSQTPKGHKNARRP